MVRSIEPGERSKCVGKIKIRLHPTCSQLNRVFLYLMLALMSLVTFPLLPLIAENVLFMVVQDLARDIFDVF